MKSYKKDYSKNFEDTFKKPLIIGAVYAYSHGIGAYVCSFYGVLEYVTEIGNASITPIEYFTSANKGPMIQGMIKRRKSVPANQIIRYNP